MHACEAADGMLAILARMNEDPHRPLSPGRPGSAAGGNRHRRRHRPGDRGRLWRAAPPALQRQWRCGASGGALQALSRNYGPAVIVAEETQQSSRTAVRVSGSGLCRPGPQRSAGPALCHAGQSRRRAHRPRFRALTTFHEHIFQCLRKQQWDKARALIEQCSRLSGASHTLYELYLARIRYFESNPPGPDWDGAFRPVLK